MHRYGVAAVGVTLALVLAGCGGGTPGGITNTTTAFRGHYRAVLSGPSATVTYRSGVRSSETDRAAI